jgi:glycosyltransferase involved in cell wall biosynthesis
MSESNQEKIFFEGNTNIQETQLKYLKSKFRWAFITFHFLINRIKIDKNIDLIISSSHSIAKGVNKSSINQLHVSYFQARNFKYIWSDYNLYFGNLGGFLLFPIIYMLRKIDIYQAQKPDFIISNSYYVKNWVKKTYNRDSTVIYPPVDLSSFNIETKKMDYYVTVGRLEPYKRFDLIIKAFNKTGNKLIVIGDGSQFKELKKLGKENIEFLGFLESREVFKHISKAKGFIHAGIEDFGIAPIAAQACGTPVIGYNRGGLKETVIHSKTGFLFDEQTSDSIINALKEFEKIAFNFEDIRKNSLRFSEKRFEAEFEKEIFKLYNNWK